MVIIVICQINNAYEIIKYLYDNKYKIYIYADNSNSIDVSKLKLAISDDSNSATEAKAFVNTDTYSITNKEDSACTTDCTAYKIDEGTLAAGDSTKTKYIRVWVDENQVTDELNDTAVSLKLFVVSEVDETQATS